MSFRLKILLLSIPLFLLLVQFIYFFETCARKKTPDFQPDLVVVYGGDPDSSRWGLDLARQINRPIYISESLWKLVPFKSKIQAMGQRVTLDPRANTTDQNARYAAPFIRKGGYRKVALVCAWHHEPRALFLARLYLLGSGVQVVSYPTQTAPPLFWTQRLFWLQMVNFWGSLGRVVLHWVGIDHWPRGQLLNTEPDFDATGIHPGDLKELRKYRF